MTDAPVTEQKAQTRKAAFAQRKAARAVADSAKAVANLVDYVLAQDNVRVVSAYMAIQTEVDPMPAMHRFHAAGLTVALPVIQGKAQPLLFREWTPNAAMIEGDFGALIPRAGDMVTPDMCITPLVAFDGYGNRMGYGGGFYDRTFAVLRARAPVLAVGFAFAGQEVDRLPVEPTDHPLDAIVTEQGVRQFTGG